MESSEPGTRSTPLEDYALLSDLRTGPLVSRDGSIDWLCFPRFDSPSVFAALIGTEDDGRWRLWAPGGQVVSRRYLPRTFVLETIWRTKTGTAQVLDFLPPRSQQADVLRKVSVLEGQVNIAHDLRIRFDYNRSKPWTRKITLGDGTTTGLLSVAGPDALLLTGPQLHPDVPENEDQTSSAEHPGPNRPDDYSGAASGNLTGEFTLTAGESQTWALSWFRSHLPAPTPLDPEEALERTINYWHQWSSKVQVRDRYDEMSLRSLMVLRALTDHETGGLVAAPTTSLPEEFGGQRNWDYRYTWLRDASLTINTLVTHDFTEGALHWRDWLLRAVAGDPDDLQIMYGIAGERVLTEFELDHLAGYADSKPVRIGNGAYGQYQADVVGEVMLALAKLRDAGHDEDDYSWALQQNMLTFLERNMERKGHGIWEMRGESDYFTHGRAMMFAAFDQGIKAIEKHGLSGPIESWRKLREQLREEIFQQGYNLELNSFTQAYSNTEVDASLLQLPNTGLIDPQDPRMLGTVKRIEKELLDDAGLLLRYRTQAGKDGLPGGEYSFLMCSFWLVEQYARSDRLAEAKKLLDRLSHFATDLGLFAEEYDSAGGRLAGNFPQAFSHLGFVRAVDAVEGRLPETGR